MEEECALLEVVSGKNLPGVRHRCQEPLCQTRSVNFRGTVKEISTLYEIVVANNPDAQRYCDNCGFSSIFKFSFTNSDRGLVEALAERWWQKTKSFHFRDFEVGLLPVDWYMLTGIPTGVPSKRQVVMPPLEVGTKYKDLDMYFGTLPTFGAWDDNVNWLSCGTLRRYILSRSGIDNTHVAEHLTRMFFLWCLGHSLLANSTGKVDKRWILLFQNLNEVGDYDWGIASLGNTYKYLDEWSSCESKDLCGMVVVLEYWYYYYFHNLQPLLNEPEVPLPAGRHEDVFPKMLLFTRERIQSRKRDKKGGQKDVHKHSCSIARDQIDLRLGSCTWQPWINSSYAQGDAYDAALQLSGMRVLFYDLQNPNTRMSVYLAERFQRQIYGVTVIPANPPQLQQVQDREIVFVSPDRYYAVEPDVYTRWWRTHSVGGYVTEPYHAQNVDHLAVGSSRLPPSVLPTHAPDNLMSQSYTYDTQQQMPQLPEVDFTLPVATETGAEQLVEVPMHPCPYNWGEFGMNLVSKSTFVCIFTLYWLECSTKINLFLHFIGAVL